MSHIYSVSLLQLHMIITNQRVPHCNTEMSEDLESMYIPGTTQLVLVAVVNLDLKPEMHVYTSTTLWWHVVVDLLKQQRKIDLLFTIFIMLDFYSIAVPFLSYFCLFFFAPIVLYSWCIHATFLL